MSEPHAIHVPVVGLCNHPIIVSIDVPIDDMRVIIINCPLLPAFSLVYPDFTLMSPTNLWVNLPTYARKF